jgi:hypothetical protein
MDHLCLNIESKTQSTSKRTSPNLWPEDDKVLKLNGFESKSLEKNNGCDCIITNSILEKKEISLTTEKAVSDCAEKEVKSTTVSTGTSPPPQTISTQVSVYN